MLITPVFTRCVHCPRHVQTLWSQSYIDSFDPDSNLSGSTPYGLGMLRCPMKQTAGLLRPAMANSGACPRKPGVGLAITNIFSSPVAPYLGT